MHEAAPQRDKKLTLLRWGRFDPEYSRNSVLCKVLVRAGVVVEDFRPVFSQTADLEFRISGRKQPNLIWVPCFRQRDLPAAIRYARKFGIPLVADPLISAWDKRVKERQRLRAESGEARRLLAWESQLFKACDLLIADTPAHATFFETAFGIRKERTQVVWVGADQDIFCPAPTPRGQPPEILFWGNFLGLHGIETIIKAARIIEGQAASWTLIGHGPEIARAQHLAEGLSNLRFECPVPYPTMGQRVAKSSIVLGAFGMSEKAERVIPNKVFQGLSVGRPVVTRYGTGYPAGLDKNRPNGIRFVPPGDAQSLAEEVSKLLDTPGLMLQEALAARHTYERLFSQEVLLDQVQVGLSKLGLDLT